MRYDFYLPTRGQSATAEALATLVQRGEALGCLPHPFQKPHPPIWIGGHSRAALRRAARYGDGWHPVGANPAIPLRPAEFGALVGELRRLCEVERRDPAAL